MNFKGSHFPKDVILMLIRWYIAYPLSYRHVEELLAERGLSVDHATVNRWVVKHSPTLESKFRNTKKGVGKSWRMDETYIKVKGEWVYYYRAVDKEGQTIDFYLSKTRDTKAALTFFDKAITSNGVPSKVNMDKSGANLAGLQHVNQELPNTEQIVIRQVKYLNNMIEQDHRAIKRMVKPMLGFKNFLCAEATLAGIELYHM
ncbi:MAG: IS6 family transposase, partial [Pseudomonadota bacterium]|nr:IS6 family transposase [Pseudomonadota bacterium]